MLAVIICCKVSVLLCLLSAVNSQSCTCDLLSGVCEVDCCCDSDCTAADNSTFNSCLENAFNPSTQICIFDQVVFVRNSLLTSQIRTNDLYCVVANTFNERNFYSSPLCISTNSCLENLDFQYSFVSEATIPLFTNFYKSGDPILIEYPSGARSLFSIPASAVSSICDSNNPVNYLFSRTSACTRSFTDLNSACIANSVLDYQSYEGFEVYATFYQNATLNSNQTTLNQTVLNRTVGINSDCTVGTCNLQLTGATCSNAVASVDYLIITNGSDGIVTVMVSYTLQNITSADLPFSQTFSVRFQTFDISTPIQRSGNPGYIVGKPLMIRVEDVTTSVVTNTSDIFLFDPSSTGVCNQNRLPILFGQDQRTGCQVAITTNCTVLQQDITSLLNQLVFDSNTSQVSIGIFGNADIANSADFIPLVSGSNSAAPSNSLSGCDGMVLSASFEILFANTGSITSPQPKVAAVRHRYGEPRPIRFFCAPGSPGCAQVVEISTSVSFVDISETPLSIQRSSPTKEDQLPVSFLFPLTNIDVQVDVSDFFIWVIVFLALCLFLIMLCT